MLIKPLKIGNVTAENNVFLAPLAGYTNYPFRLLCKGYGAGLCFTEMVSAKGLKYDSEKTRELLYTNAAEGVCAAQIFGSDPKIMREACESEDLKNFPIVDINMGCPVPKIYKNG
ncbi:MAG: tRNA-dihydrouridine synthase [Clostridia bacterium]|nr:tRNA-dihydrouridine synthase [Clostridia bacterium]